MRSSPNVNYTSQTDIKHVEEVDKKLMQLIHYKWGHPSNSEMEHIVCYYKCRGFPKGFLAALKKFKCKVCTVCKSASVYKNTKQMKEKMVHNKRRKTSTGGPKKPTMEQQVLETKMSEIKSEDDLLKAFASEELHLDLAHSILLGYFNKRYYLLFVVGGLKIGCICTDNEFTASTAFKAFCKASMITYAPSAAYTHTMQAREEGAVQICKDHVSCLLKSSNAPARCWPFALLHFCSTYNYWPGAHSPLQWESMDNSQFNFNMEQDLCDDIAAPRMELPKEHPLVSVNTTQADRGIEGAFL
eukprot:1284401-Rhodomonas_salina.1